MLWIVGFLAYAFGLLSMLVVMRRSLRVYQKKVLALRTSHQENFQKMISRIYHADSVPLVKRLRGLAGLGVMCALRLMNLVELSARKYHSGYGDLAKTEVRETLELWRLTEEVSAELEQKVLSTVKEFEKFQ